MEALVVLCSSARTGSSLICDYLSAAGIPASELRVFSGRNFNPPLTAIQIAEYLMAKENQVCGINPIIHHLHSKGDHPNPAIWLWQIVKNIKVSRVIWFYLSRHDRVRQAISYERAILTGEWATFKQPMDASGMPFDCQQIENRIAHIEYQHNWWIAFFAQHQINPMRLYYEELAADIPGTMNRIFSEIGMGKYIPEARARRKQAHSDVEGHVKRYYKHLLTWSGLWSRQGRR